MNQKESPGVERTYKEALETYRNLAKKNPDTYMPYVALILNDLGMFYNETQKFSEAKKAYKEALQIKRVLTEKNPEDHISDVAMILLNLGALYYDTRNFDDAEEIYSEALHIYETLAEENPEYAADVALTLNNLGGLYLYMQHFDDAEKTYTEALQIRRTLAEKNPDIHTPHIAMILKNLGILHSSLHRFSEAERAYTEALQIRRTLAEKNPDYMPAIASTLNNLGSFYKDIQRFSDAEKVYKEALKDCRALAEEHPDIYTPDVAATLDNLGTFYTVTQKFTDAEKAYNEALKIRKALAEQNPGVYTSDVALTLNNLGNLYTSTQKYEEAEEAYSTALQIRRVLAEQNPGVYASDVAATLNNLGNVYSDIKKFSQAEKTYNEALEIRKTLAEQNPEAHIPDIAMVLTNMGNLYKDLQKYDKAEKVYTEALKIRKILAEKNPDVFNHDIASTLNNMGNLYKDLQKYDKAEKVYTEALQKYKEVPLWFDTARTAYNLFTVISDNEMLGNSRKILEMAILFSKEKGYKYAQKGKYENIYLTLLDQEMGTFGVLETLRDPQHLSLLWDQVISEEELEKAQGEVSIQRALVQKVLEEEVPYLELIPAHLAENVLYVYIQEMRNYLLFFVIDNGGTKGFECKKEFLEIGNKLLYNLQIQRGAAEKTDDLTFIMKIFDKYSRKLSEILPNEIKRLIQEKDQIVFSPDSNCSFLPLEALRINGEYLCIEKTVVRATSIRQFLTHQKRRPSFDSSLIVGNPWSQCDKKSLIYSFSSNAEYFKISFLQNAQEEAKILTGKLPNSRVLSGKTATGEKFLSELPKHSLIHFSGHGDLGRILFFSGPFKGFPPPFEPEEFSNLRKAERIEGTRRINMMEEWHPVTDLDLFDIPLTEGAVIFLNACETGQHTYAGGGYYQGLPAVFLKNGANSIVSSLIPVFDNSSKEFAVKFYENLLRTHSVSQSLKEARFWAKEEYKAQVYWLPYIHYGSPV